MASIIVGAPESVSVGSLAPVDGTEAAQTIQPLLAGRRTLVLTGAGMSTDSGIPDYRGPDSPPHQPMLFSEFVSGETAQRRYWARSHVGWQALAAARCNDGHRALAELGRLGVTGSVITQNVDGLHSAAGSDPVIDLHGLITRVICLDCGEVSRRADLHSRLEELNPGFGVGITAPVAPDGDAGVTEVDSFRIAACEHCGGVLKPDVVFFGENVPRPRVDRCMRRTDEAEALLVLGSSLTVMSGLRFLRRAHPRGVPIVIVNRGETRGDPLATVKIEVGCSEVLRSLVDLCVSVQPAVSRLRQ